jgi:enoyl-[acyl-carrier-protein] reductase (NADH)
MRAPAGSRLPFGAIAAFPAQNDRLARQLDRHVDVQAAGCCRQQRVRGGAKELGPRGIAVNGVAPGAMETDCGGGTLRENAELDSFVAAQTARGRAGLPDDVGGAISALISALLLPGNRWSAGQRVEVAGGMCL